jgi:NADH dehydrogenase
VLLMPGNKRRARLITDWTIGLFFGRDASELGMLGHPPQLQGQSSGGTGEDGEPIESDGLGARSVDLAQETGLEDASPPSSPVL